MKYLVCALAFACSGCQSLFNIDSEVVNTPLHDDTRVFYFDIGAQNKNPPQQIKLIASDAGGLNEKTQVDNGDPVPIVINKVVLPRHLFDTTVEQANDRANNRKTYDIAIVVD